jgi:hypothetical protein
MTRANLDKHGLRVTTHELIQERPLRLPRLVLASRRQLGDPELQRGPR